MRRFVIRTWCMDGALRRWRLRWVVCLALAAPFVWAAKEGEPRDGGIQSVIESYRRAQGARAGKAALAGFVEIGMQERDGLETVRLVYARAPRSLRIETLADDLRIVQGTDGATVWAYMQKPGGERRVVALPPEVERGLRLAAEAAFHDPLLEPGRFGYELALRDESPMAEGQRLVEISEGGRAVAFVRIDRETGRVLARWTVEGAGETQVHRGYREIDGCLTPSEVITMKDGVELGRWRLADLRLGETPDPDLFAPPRDMPPSVGNSKL